MFKPHLIFLPLHNSQLYWENLLIQIHSQNSFSSVEIYIQPGELFDQWEGGREGRRGRDGTHPTDTSQLSPLTVLLSGLSADQPGVRPAEEPDLPAGGDGQHHHQAEAGAAGQGQHRGDPPAADQDEDVHEPHHAEEPYDGRPRRPARWGIVHGNSYKSSKMFFTVEALAFFVRVRIQHRNSFCNPSLPLFAEFFAVWKSISHILDYCLLIRSIYWKGCSIKHKIHLHSHSTHF